MAFSASILPSVATSPSPTQRLAALLLGADLEEWVAERRDPEVRRSWRVIANELARATNHEIDISGEALRKWFEHVDARWPEDGAA